MTPISRRDFLETGSTGIALLIGIGQLGCRNPPADRAGPPFAPNQWLRIGTDGRITLINDKSEMGQGAGSVVPLIVAEELGVAPAAIELEHAKPGATFDDMGTSGSDTVASRWIPLRQAAAAAREMLIAAAAAQWKVPAAECAIEAGVVKHREGNRAAPLGKFVAAAAKLPVPTTPMLKPPGAFTLVGTRTPRLDTRAVVTGAKQYGMDLRIPGMMRAAIARCPVPTGKLVRWSGEKAKQVAGVRQVVQVPTGIAVVAESTWAAFKGRDALELVWDESSGHGLDSAALWTRLARGFTTMNKDARIVGNARAAVAGAARRLEAEYRYPFQAHGAIEPLNAVAHVRPDGCEIWAGIQNPNRAQQEAAKLLGTKPEQVVVNVLPLGGGFGRRISPDFVLEAVEVSRAARMPVQLVWSREDDITWDMYQSAAIVRMNAGLGPDGTIVGWSHQIADFHLSMFGEFDPSTFKPAEETEPWGGIDTPYEFPALAVKIARQETPVRTGAWRSVFYPSSVLARECFLDEVAHASLKDPVALRLDLLAKPNPVTRRGITFDNRARLRGVVSLAAEKGGWGTPAPSAAADRRVGRGIACNEYHQRTVVATVAEVSVGASGDVTVHRVVTAIDCGRPVSIDGIEAQIEGATMWALSTLFGKEITFAEGRTVQRNFDSFPVLRMGQAPRVEAHIVPSDLPPWGVGEQPVPTVIPAVLNAIYAATGNRIRQVPITGA